MTPDTMYNLEEAVDEVLRRFKDDGIDESVREWANQELRPIYTDLQIVLGDGDAQEQFLLDYIQREADNPERETPICTCTDLGCKVEDGKLPRDVREADDIREGMKTHQQRKFGRVIVFEEAREELRRKTARCWYVTNGVLIHFRESKDDPPDREPLVEQFDPEREVGVS